MRSLCIGFLAAAVMTLAAYTSLAQLPPGGRFGDDSGLLLNKGVQDELKLTEDQKTKIRDAVGVVREKYGDDLMKAREAKDREKGREVLQKMATDLHKAAVEILNPEQRKRLKEIHYQTASPALFTHHDVQKELTLTDKQKEEIKRVVEEYNKESREIREGGEKGVEAIKKRTEARKESLEKIKGMLTDDQKKAWKELTGAPFELRFGRAPAVKEDK
jgi:Spy/CpxP family protein refolding chaperone